MSMAWIEKKLGKSLYLAGRQNNIKLCLLHFQACCDLKKVFGIILFCMFYLL